LYDPLAIIALVVSIASVAFVIMKEGIGLALGYRESESTSRRRREIESKLRAEVRVELKSFLDTVDKGDRNEAKELEAIINLGRHAHHARSMCGNLLENMTYYMSSAMTYLAGTLTVFFLTLYVGLNSPNLSIPENFVPFLAYVMLTLALLYMTVKQLKRHYSLRVRSLRLGENPTLDYCGKLVEELEK
jgi:hypothetical protein